MMIFNRFANFFLPLVALLVVVKVEAVELNFVGIEVAPWASLDKETGEYVGIFADLAYEIERRTGYEIKVTLSPYARINRELETNRQDCTILIVDEERENIIKKGEYLFSLPVGVIPKRSVVLGRYKDLYGKNISLLRGAAISHKFNSDQKLTKQFDTDYMIILRKLEYDRIDAIAGVIPTIQYLAKQEGLSKILGEPLSLSSEPVYLQCSKTSSHIQYLPVLNSAIKSIVSDGSIVKIFDKYFQENE
jgi:polar amino acid transport system substrate-binding protein